MTQERFVTRKEMLHNITSQIEELEHRIKSLKNSLHNKLDYIENSINNNDIANILNKIGTDTDDASATIFGELEEIEIAIGVCSAGTICGQFGSLNSSIVSAINNETSVLLAYIKAASYAQTCAQNSDCPSGFICGSTGIAYGGYASDGVAHGGFALADKVCVSGHLTAVSLLPLA